MSRNTISVLLLLFILEVASPCRMAWGSSWLGAWGASCICRRRRRCRWRSNSPQSWALSVPLWMSSSRRYGRLSWILLAHTGYANIWCSSDFVPACFLRHKFVTDFVQIWNCNARFIMETYNMFALSPDFLNHMAANGSGPHGYGILAWHLPHERSLCNSKLDVWYCGAVMLVNACVCMLIKLSPRM